MRKIYKVKDWLKVKKLNDAWIMLCLLSPRATYIDKKQTSNQIKQAIMNGKNMDNVERAINNKLEVFRKLKLSPDESRLKPEFYLI